MVKVLVVISPVIYKSLPLDRTLKELKHESRIFFNEEFSLVCSYAKKKLDELGFHSARNKYNLEKFIELKNMIQNFNPDAILFVNIVTSIFSPKQLSEIREIVERQNCKLLIFFVDPLIKLPHVNECLNYFDRIFSYDHGDIRRLKDVASIEYCPVGYPIEYEQVLPSGERAIDIVFVGAPWKRRLTFFEPLAKFALENQIKFQFYGPTENSRYFWKKNILSLKFPNASKCVIDRRINPSEAAKVYSNAKICLNLHTADVTSPNPRTFEILATKSFELVDERENYSGLIPGKDLVTFNGSDDLVEQVKYFLRHEDERMEIAMNGWKKVVPEFRLSKCLERVLQ